MAFLTPGFMLLAALITVVVLFALGATAHQIYLRWQARKQKDDRDYTRSGDWTSR